MPHVQVAQHLEGIVDGLHPGLQLLLEGAGQVSEFPSHGNGGPRHYHPAIVAILYRLLEAGGQGDERLAGAGLPHQGDQPDALVEQGVEGEVLLPVAGPDAPGALAVVQDRHEPLAGDVHPGEGRPLEIGLVRQGAILVRAARPVAIENESSLRPEGRDSFRADLHFKGAGVKILDMDVVGLVVLGLESHRVRLDPEIDVLGDQDGRRPGIGLLDVARQGDETVVHGGAVHRDGRSAVLAVEENAEPAPRGQRNPFTQAALAAERVEQPRDRPCVLAAVAGFPLEAVDLLDDFDGNEDAVILKAEERVRVVEQDVGVEDVVFYQGSFGASPRATAFSVK